MNQTIDNRTSGTGWSTKVLLAACLMVVATLLAACLMMAAQPAHASTTFTVNSTADTGDATPDGACDTCTLREAVQEANATSGADTIKFAIPGTGVKTIVVNATGLGALPAITDQVTIDGYTQPKAHPNTKAVGNDAVLKVQLNGTSVSQSGLRISGSSGSVIKGLVINRFGANGIQIFGDSIGNRIEGNFIGTDPTGTLDRGNHTNGVSAFSDGGVTSETVVGGTTPASRNLISGNGNSGVEMGNGNFNGVQPGDNRIQGNYLGTDKSGTKDLGNGGDGLFLEDTSDNTVGGKTAASRNVISGNGGGLDTFDASRTHVLGNRIGTTADGKGALGNDQYGVNVDGSQTLGSHNFFGDGTTTGGNTIAFNGGDGVVVRGGSLGNRIDHNPIFSNGGIGIDLMGGSEDAAGRTANDLGDADTGPNGLQNKPVITSAKTVNGITSIKGKLNTLPNPDGQTGYSVQFFSNPSGGDEGKSVITGEINAIPDASGNATFTFSPASKVAAGRTITATAQSSSPVPEDDANTSEFSAPRTVAAS